MGDRTGASRLLIEAAVIVFSVLLALAADAAWAERQARRAAREDLRTVLEELREQQFEIGIADSWHSRALAGSQALRTELEAVEVGAPVIVSDTLASQLAWVYITEGESPVLDAFIDAGHTERIENEELRRLLLTWGPVLEDMASDDTRTAEHIADQILPYVNGEFDFGRPLDLVFEMYVREPDPSRLGQTSLRSTLALRNLVARHISLLTLITLQSRAALDRLTQMISFVERELQRA